VVNLEVVRARLARAADGSPETLPFAELAMGQAEESVKLNEGVGSLLLLISGAVDSNGVMHCTPAGGDEHPELRFEVDHATADRTVPGLRILGQALGFTVETDDRAVILTFPQDGSTATRISE